MGKDGKGRDRTGPESQDFNSGRVSRHTSRRAVEESGRPAGVKERRIKNECGLLIGKDKT